MTARRAVCSALASFWLIGAPVLVRAEEPQPASDRAESHDRQRFADLRVRSGTEATEIQLGVPSGVEYQDQSKARTGKVVVDEIRLFFPGATLPRSRLVSVGDRIVEEARLFVEGDGVVMTVVVRRPVGYSIERKKGRLTVRVQPGLLLAEGARPPDLGEEEDRRREHAIERERRKREREQERATKGRVAPGTIEGGGLEAPTVELPELREGEGLTVDAAKMTYDREANQVIAKGGVTIARAGTLLTAEEVRIDRETKIGAASGDVQLSDPQGTVRAERFDVDLDDETGVLTDAEVFLNTTHASITGARFEKSYGQTYHIENGTFTTCQCGVGAPSWSIAGREIDVTLDGYGFVEGATFRVLDVPILYLPVAAFPAKVSRQTGLLAPQFGFSKKRGATYLQPFYIVVNKSADLTLSADVETEARVGGIAEYRYALDRDSYGTLNGAFFDEMFRNNAERDIVDSGVADQDIPDQRWSVTSDMRQGLPLEVIGFTDVLAVSDDFFLREIPTFSFDPQYERTLRTSRFTSSRAGLYRVWERATVLGQAIYYQDFIQEDDLTLQRLPQLSAFASQRFFDRHLKLRFNGEAVNFVRDVGFDGPRLDVFPQAEVPFRWQEFVRGGLNAGFRETAYHIVDDEVVTPITETGSIQESETDLGTSPTRELFIAGADIGTELQRIFVVDGENVEKLKHTIEPAVEYLFVPDVEQDDLPSYDFTDRLNQRNLFTYGVTTRLLAKLRHAPAAEANPLGPGELNAFTGVSAAPFDDERTRDRFGAIGGLEAPLGEPEPGADDEEPLDAEEDVEDEDLLSEDRAERRRRKREDDEALSKVSEWGRLAVFQSYDLDETLQADRTDHFSDVDVALRVNPAHYLSLLYDSSIDARDSDLTAANVGLVLRDPRARRPGVFLQSGQPAALGLSYRFITEDVLEEVDGALLVPLADSLSTFYQTRYDAVATEFLENRWGFRLISQCQCWILDLSVTDRINPNETEVRAQVTLVGLGSIGRAR